MKKLLIYIFLIAMSVFFFQCKAQEVKSPSSKSQMLYKTMKSVNASEKAFNALLNKPKKGTDKVSARKMNRKLLTVEREVDGFKVLTIQSSRPLSKHIIILHGGAYVAEAMKGHRVLMEKLALSYNFRVTFIDYPLAPEHSAYLTHEIVGKAYKLLTDAYEDDEFYLFGDSAGGGLALAFLQTLRDDKASRMPEKTVLQSPWLDISMTNPDIVNFIEKDVLLDLDGLIECGKLYAGDKDGKNPLVSPIYGNMEDLNKIKLFVSTHELFYPDCLLLKSMIDSAEGSSVDITVREKMIHDWIVLPIKEQDQTIMEIADFLMED